MTLVCPTVHSLLSKINCAKPNLIGIDGLDGCRKTSLAQKLAGHTRYQVISLDKLLNKHKGAYAEHIDSDALRSAVCQGASIVEGVCLKRVLALSGLQPDLLIYVKRIRHGLWADEDWLGLEQDIELYLKKLSIAAAALSGDSTLDSEDLSTEIIRYHHVFRPHESADLIYSWLDG